MRLKVYSKKIRKSVHVEIDNNLSLEQLVGKIQKAFDSDSNKLNELYDDTHSYCFFTHLKASEYRLRYEGSLYAEYTLTIFLNDSTLKSAKETSCIVAMPTIKSKLLFVFDRFGDYIDFIITRNS